MSLFCRPERLPRLEPPSQAPWALHVYLFDRRILPASAAAFMQPTLARGAEDMPTRRRLDDAPAKTSTADAVSSVTYGGLNLSELNDEAPGSRLRNSGWCSSIVARFVAKVLLQILNHLPGWMGGRAEATGLGAWRREAIGDSWWQTRCCLEFAAQLRPTEDSWRKRYRCLLGMADAWSAGVLRTGSWCYKSHRHGLGDRVAAPQLFVGPTGQKLFCYGGWTDRGPQTDLHSDVEPWRFARSQESGQLPHRGGVSTLTPLWYGEDAPSAEHLRATARDLQRLSGVPQAEGGALVPGFEGL
eukprot:s305_g1.t1